MAEMPMILTSFTTMAVLGMLLGVLVPGTQKPWWQSRPRLALQPQLNDAVTTVPVLPEEAESAPIATVAPLQLVRTEERRRQGLPYVGRERRASRAEAGADRRRDGSTG